MMALGIGLLAVVSTGQEAPVLKSPKQRYSYALGMDLGNQLRKQSVELDTELFSKGLKDALSGGKTLLTEAEVRASIGELQAELKRRQVQATKSSSQEELKAGQAFLAENKKKEGVVTLPSGLQYKVLKKGDGKKPTDADTVVCHYRGTLLNGTEFDSSYRRKQPATFPVKGVIPGWREALKLMAVGSRYQLFIPSELAYGQQGAGSQIGPNATLIFEVELLAVK
jgi:FKBP-type peptidyl-prolyl cis-trans isomerase FklB